MASNREIITVQLGSASNFVGAHWWNMQESSFIFDRVIAEKDATRLNHDVLFREGRNINNKVTFTPRLVTVDFSGNVGRTNLSRNLYPDVIASRKHQDSFGLAATVVTQSSRPKNQFLSDLEAEENSKDGSGQSGVSARVGIAEEKIYQLDDVVSTWTDYLRVPFHPKSLLTCESLNCYGEMSRFDAGENLCKNGKLLDEFEDRLRFFAEDSNCLQGFHFVCDIHDGMGGISSEIAQYICDEYPRNVVLAATIFPGDLALQTACDQDQYIWNAANGLTALASHCAVILPLSTAAKLWKRPMESRKFRFLNYKPELLYHTSSLLAAALETATTPWRRHTRTTFDQLPHVCDVLTFGKRKLAALSLALPLGCRETESLNDHLKESNDLVSVTPYVDAVLEEDQSTQLPRMVNISMRGVKDVAATKRPISIDASYDAACSTASELLLERYNSYATSLSTGAIYEPIYTKAPFSHVFESVVGRNGLVTGKGRPNEQAVTSAPTLSWLESTPRAAQFLSAVTTEASHLKWQKLQVDKDHVDQILNQLHEMMEPFCNRRYC